MERVDLVLPQQKPRLRLRPIFVACFQAGTGTLSPARHRRAGRKNDTDQVRRWREGFNEGAETPGAKSRGL